jgi:thioredoxin-related protein
MKRLAIALISAWAWFQAGAAEINWMTSLPNALAKAKAEKKLVMVDFTGSDWCPWCIKLNKEVFSQPEFAEYAQKRLVLVEADFPRHKELSAELKDANQALLKKYRVEGFPTVIVLDGQGKQLGQLGYEAGGPKPFIDRLAKLDTK